MPKEENVVRLNKFIAECGVASRRKADELILHNKVMVNQQIVNELGFKITPLIDRVTVSGVEVRPEAKKVYILLNKPIGYITTAKDQFGRPTVLDLVKTDLRIFPIGRLDYDTSGLLILTNDGEFANKIMHPKFKVDKTYIAEVVGIVREDEVQRLRKGVTIDEFLTSPAEVDIVSIKDNTTTLKITIHEGKNRQVRKMCQAVGYKVRTLKRVSLGKLILGDLKIGKWRFLSNNEVEYLRNL